MAAFVFKSGQCFRRPGQHPHVGVHQRQVNIHKNVRIFHLRRLVREMVLQGRNASSRHFYFTNLARLRDRFTALAQVFNVHFQGFLHQRKGFLLGVRRRDAAGKIRRIGAEIFRPLLDDDGKLMVIFKLAAEYRLTFSDATVTERGSVTRSRDECKRTVRVTTLRWQTGRMCCGSWSRAPERRSLTGLNRPPICPRISGLDLRTSKAGCKPALRYDVGAVSHQFPHVFVLILFDEHSENIHQRGKRVVFPLADFIHHPIKQRHHLVVFMICARAHESPARPVARRRLLFPCAHLT